MTIKTVHIVSVCHSRRHSSSHFYNARWVVSPSTIYLTSGSLCVFDRYCSFCCCCFCERPFDIVLMMRFNPILDYEDPYSHWCCWCCCCCFRCCRRRRRRFKYSHIEVYRIECINFCCCCLFCHCYCFCWILEKTVCTYVCTHTAHEMEFQFELHFLVGLNLSPSTAYK